MYVLYYVADSWYQANLVFNSNFIRVYDNTSIHKWVVVNQPWIKSQ